MTRFIFAVALVLLALIVVNCAEAVDHTLSIVKRHEQAAKEI